MKCPEGNWRLFELTSKSSFLSLTVEIKRVQQASSIKETSLKQTGQVRWTGTSREEEPHRLVRNEVETEKMVERVQRGESGHETHSSQNQMNPEAAPAERLPDEDMSVW